MAEKLIGYYTYIAQKMGVVGKIELAILTKLPSTLAATAPDSPENLKLFEEAIKKLTGKASPSL